MSRDIFLEDVHVELCDNIDSSLPNAVVEAERFVATGVRDVSVPGLPESLGPDNESNLVSELAHQRSEAESYTPESY